MTSQKQTITCYRLQNNALESLDENLKHTMTIIQTHNPTIKEMIDAMEDGEKTPTHHFLAQNINQKIESLREIILAYQIHLPQK